MITTEVDIPELTPQIRKLKDFDKIAKAEFTAAMRPALALSVADIRPRVPTLSGALEGSLGSSIKFAMGDEVRGVITASATNGGFPYGYALDASNKYRYAGKRKKTKGWMKGVIRRKKNEVLALFAAATVRIVNKLAVGANDGE